VRFFLDHPVNLHLHLNLHLYSRATYSLENFDHVDTCTAFSGLQFSVKIVHIIVEISWQYKIWYGKKIFCPPLRWDHGRITEYLLQSAGSLLVCDKTHNRRCCLIFMQKEGVRKRCAGCKIIAHASCAEQVCWVFTFRVVIIKL